MDASVSANVVYISVIRLTAYDSNRTTFAMSKIKCNKQYENISFYHGDCYGVLLIDGREQSRKCR